MELILSLLKEERLRKDCYESLLDETFNVRPAQLKLFLSDLKALAKDWRNETATERGRKKKRTST